MYISPHIDTDCAPCPRHRHLGTLDLECNVYTPLDFTPLLDRMIILAWGEFDHTLLPPKVGRVTCSKALAINLLTRVALSLLYDV